MSLGQEKRAALPWAGRALEAVPVRPWAALGRRPWGLGELSRTRGAGDKESLLEMWCCFSAWRVSRLHRIASCALV